LNAGSMLQPLTNVNYFGCRGLPPIKEVMGAVVCGRPAERVCRLAYAEVLY
jgi:hypothetical protein